MMMVGPGMVSRAVGCSGAAAQPEAGWNGLYGVDQPDTPTTGVYVLHGQLFEMGDQLALDALEVTVHDAAGGSIPGSLSLHPVSDLGAYRDVVVTWKPDAGFVANQKYSVSWSVAGSPANEGSATLTTASAPKPPAAPVLGVEKFGRRWQLEGELSSCSKVPYEQHFDSSTCSYKTTGSAPFGADETLITQVTFRFAPPGPKPALAWLARVEPVPGKGELVAADGALFFSSAMSPGVLYPTYEFRGEASEYCLRFVTEDLADGSTHSDEVCAPLDPTAQPGPSLLEKALAECDAPPKPELQAAWCKSHAGDSQCSDDSGCSLSSKPRSSSWLGGVLLLASGAWLGLRRRKNDAAAR